MTLKDDAKFEGKLIRGLKNDIRNLVNFHGKSWKSDNLHLDEKVQKSYLTILMSDSKFEEKRTFRSKNDMTNLVYFNMGSGKSENVHFNVLLLLIAYKVSAKKVQKGYLSWHWKVIQTLKKNSLFFEKWHEQFGLF